MALVAFLRGVNVGGHKAFKPSALAKDLADFDVINVGAAGTFVIRKPVSEAAVRRELTEKLPFATEIMICDGREILDLVAADPFREETDNKDLTCYVSILADEPKTLTSPPISRPEGNDWQVKLIGVTGRFALSLHRRMGRTLIYPQQVVEKSLGVSATTRNWNTIRVIAENLTPSG